MPTHEGFLQAICAEPDDDAHRLIYADWLEEIGSSVRAEFIRLQIRIAGTSENDPRLSPLRQSEKEIHDRHAKQWRSRLPDLDGITWGEYERGFVTWVTARTESHFHRHAAHLFRCSPIQKLKIEKVGGGQVWHMSHSPYMGRTGGRRGIRDLATSPHLARIRKLDLSRTVIEHIGARNLTDSPYLIALEDLNLSNDYLTDVGAQILASSHLLSQLRTLDLSYNQIGDAGTRAIAESPSTTNLVFLDLTRNDIGPEGVDALVASPYLTKLNQLRLYWNRIDVERGRRLRNRFGNALDYRSGSDFIRALVDSLGERGVRPGEAF